MIEFEAVGRVVWGTPGKPQQKTNDAGQKLTNDDGSPKMEWIFGLAIQKTDPMAKAFREACAAAAKEVFPAGKYPEGFAWKVKDGDTALDGKGRPFSEKPGRAGAIIVTVATSLPPNLFIYNHSAQKWEQGKEGAIKCGDYVRVPMTIKGHTAINAKAKAGLYINPQCVCLHEYGEAIAGAEFDPNARGYAAPPAPKMPPPPPQTQQGTRHDAFTKGPGGAAIDEDSIPF